MTRPAKSLLLILLIAANVIASFWLGQRVYRWMPPQASEAAREVDDLFSLLVSLSTFILLAFLGVLFFSLITQRASSEDWSDGPALTGNPLLESIWTITPILLVLWLAVLGAQTLQRIHDLAPGAEEVPPPPPVTVNVTAQQWAWTFEYPSAAISSAELHLPVDRTVHLVLHTQDVIHGFYVPSFRVKQDIVPGRSLDLVLVPSREGRYRLYDSQFSGTYFSLMAADVVVESDEKYDSWLRVQSSQPPRLPPNPALAEHGATCRHALVSRWPSVAPSPPPAVNDRPQPIPALSPCPS